MAPKEVCMESGEVPAAPNGILVAIPATIRGAWTVATLMIGYYVAHYSSIASQLLAKSSGLTCDSWIYD